MSLRLARALVRAVIDLVEWSPRMTVAQKYAHVESLTSALRELETERCAIENHQWSADDGGPIVRCTRCGARPGGGT